MNEHEIARAYIAVFDTALGVVVLDDLRAQFYDTALNKGNAHDTAVAVGAHDVVRYIRDTLTEARKAS